jgi:hypothetical protein
VRYRAVNDLNDVSRDAAVVVDFIGQDQYIESLESVGRSLNSKGFVTPYDDESFALELDLLNLERLRLRSGGVFQSLPESCHAGVDFLIGLGQTIPHLSTGAKTRLLGRIKKGLNEGLWPLQHEFRVAAALSKRGRDVYFHDLEEDGGYDFLATQDGMASEVEAKAISLYTAWPIKPEDINKLLVEVKECFSWKDENTIPVLGLKFSSSLSPERTQLRELVSALSEVAQTREEIYLPGIKIRSIGAVPNMPTDKLVRASRLHSLTARKTVMVNAERPKLVLELDSNKPVQLVKKMLRTLRETARDQFSRSVPGVIWMHISLASDDVFTAFASPSSNGQAGLLDRVATRILFSEKRSHLSQLVFSGGSTLNKTTTTACSSYGSAVFDSPHCCFGPNVIFPGGRKKPGSREKSPDEKIGDSPIERSAS